MTVRTDLDLTADIIDVSDITDRVDELEALADDVNDPTWRAANEDEAAEYDELHALLAELEGMGGDHQWRGDWYPAMLIADSYFETYARELADDIGAIDSNAAWPTRHIDWEAAARELAQDYSAVDVAGNEYLTR